MELTEQTQGAVVIVRPVGPLVGDDASTLSGRVRILTAQTLGRVVIDMEGVPFCDSLGIEALLDCSDTLNTLGQSLKLCCTASIVNEVLVLTGHAGTFEFHENTNSGVRSFL